MQTATTTTTTQHNTLTMVGVGEDVDNYFAPHTVVIMVYLEILYRFLGSCAFRSRSFWGWPFCVFFVDSGIGHFVFFFLWIRLVRFLKLE